MKMISIIWGSTLVILLVGLIWLGIVYNKKISVYKDAITTMESATKTYVNDKSIYPASGKHLKIYIGELQDAGYIRDLNIEDSCNGFVIVEYNKDVFEYKGYLSCDGYTSKGYKKY